MPRAIQYTQFGGPEVLHLVEVPVAWPAPGEVRLRVKAVGLNPVDMKLRSGLIPLPDPDFPRGICSDMAGVVDAVGGQARYPDGSAIAVGDEVLGWSENRSLGEQLIVTAEQVTQKPPGLPWPVAGALMTAGLTADAALTTLGIHADDVVLVSAAAGGVGLIYSQLALRRGAHVIGTAGEANHAALTALGIIPVNYGPGLADRVRAAIREHGLGQLTAVQDNAGRETIDAGLELGLAPERICSIVDHQAVAQLGLASPGRYHRSAQKLGELARLCAAGGIQLPIRATFSLDETVEAFRLLETRHGRGKIVIAIP